MVNFIICDDNKEIRTNIINIIDKVMMQNQIWYKTYDFDDYDHKFYKFINDKKSCRIYILDIETKTSSGIDAARKIREKDINSIIIFLTSHDELGYTILKNEFLFLSFICKFDNYKNKLRDSIKKALTILGQKNIIRFDSHGILYTIPADDILFITRDSVERKCVIETDYAKFKINTTLSGFLKLLDGRFKQSHRACIINIDRVRAINYQQKNIMFDNGTSTDLISAKYKKEVSKS